LTPRASEWVLPVLAVLALTRPANRGGSGRGSQGPAIGTGTELPRIPTADADFVTWFRRRRALCIAVLRGFAGEDNLPDPRLTLTNDELDAVSLSIVAQWAHETARGKAEFNFNLGGWTARRGDDFFTARDVLEKHQQRWTSYPDLPTAVDDQVHRLARGFPAAFRLLVQQPTSSAWVEQLGRSGYYSAPTGDYARAWAMHRTELGRIP
jgi:hypothetical protein